MVKFGSVRPARRFLTLDDVLEVVAYLVSAARNLAGGPSERAGSLFLDSAIRLLAIILEKEEEQAPSILHEAKMQIELAHDLLPLDMSACIERLDSLITIIARNMLERAEGDSSG